MVSPESDEKIPNEDELRFKKPNLLVFIMDLEFETAVRLNSP